MLRQLHAKEIAKVCNLSAPGSMRRHDAIPCSQVDLIDKIAPLLYLFKRRSVGKTINIVTVLLPFRQ